MASNYTLANTLAIVKTKDTNRWSEVDIASTELVDLFALYRRVQVRANDVFGNPITINLYHYESSLRLSTSTVGEWFASLGDTALIHTEGWEELKVSTANYMPLNYMTGTIKGAKSGYHPSQSGDDGIYDDIVVDTERVAPSVMHKVALYSVNGFYHQSKYQDYGVRIIGAGLAVRNAGRMNAGFINFEAIGEVTQVPITKNMITKIDEDMTWFDKITIDTTKDVTNKTVGIVIGGYLHLLDSAIRVIGPTTVTFSLRNYNWLRRIKDSLEVLDLSFMGLDNDSDFDRLSSFLTEDNIVSYLTSQYSFLVLIDNAEMAVDANAVSYSAMTGTYTMLATNPLGRLVDDSGRTVDYWPKHECGHWALKTNAYEADTIVENTMGWHDLTKLTHGAISSRPVRDLQMTMFNYIGYSK